MDFEVQILGEIEIEVDPLVFSETVIKVSGGFGDVVEGNADFLESFVILAVFELEFEVLLEQSLVLELTLSVKFLGPDGVLVVLDFAFEGLGGQPNAEVGPHLVKIPCRYPWCAHC